MTSHLTGVARGLADDELALAVARQWLLSRVTDHPVAPLADCVQLGRAVGLSMSEMQRLTGLARQTLYRHLEPEGAKERRPASPQAAIEVMLLLAAEGNYASPAVLGRRAGLTPEPVTRVITDLEPDGLCTVRRDPYSSLEAAPTPATYVALREHFDDLFLRRPDAIGVYVLVPEERQAAVAQAAREILWHHEHVVMPQSTAPSVMAGPEIAVMINAPTIRRAIAIVRDIWAVVLARAGMGFFEPVITNVIPPGTQPLVRSDVLDAFLEGVIDSGAPNGNTLRERRARYSGGPSDAALAGRCVTIAALALRRTVGNDGDPRPIIDSDSAFAELQPAHGVPVHPDATEIKRSAVAALELATDRLGPLPGGRLGSYRAPGRAPNVVKEVRPTGSELTDMARLSGEAVGAAATLGALDALWALGRVVSGNED
jgi:DNA-binding MarR family transcriptional regulator